MIYCVIGSLLTIFILWKLYKSVLKPYLLYKQYCKTLKNSKYNFIEFGFLPFASNIILNAMKDQEKYNDVYYKAKHAYQIGLPNPMYDGSVSNFGNKIMITIRNTDLIRALYSHDGTQVLEKEPQFIKNIYRIAGHSITFSQGQRWKKKRKTMTTLLNFQYILSKHPKIIEIVEKSIDLFGEKKETFDVHLLQILQNVTSSVIIQLFFGGGSIQAQDLKINGVRLGYYIRERMEEIGEQSIHPFALIFGQDYTKWGIRKKDRQVTEKISLYRQFAFKFIKHRVQEIKEGKKFQNKNQDYIQKVYYSTPEQERNTEEFITDLVDDFSTLFTAGTDTTSHTALMMIYYCVIYPDVLMKLRQEIDEYIKEDSDLNYETIKKMKYLDCVFNETVRFYQPANGILFREVKKEFVLQDILLKKDTFLITDSLANHYYHENYENPLEFKPERWITEDGSPWYPKPYTMLTFSAGPRSCIGKQLAQLEMKTMTVAIFRKYNLTMETTDLSMRLDNITYQPQKMKVKFEKIK